MSVKLKLTNMEVKAIFGLAIHGAKMVSPDIGAFFGNEAGMEAAAQSALEKLANKVDLNIKTQPKKIFVPGDEWKEPK